MKQWLTALTIMCLSFAASASIERITEVQDKLTQDLVTLQQASDYDQSFLEDVLRRKNQALRERMTQYAAGTEVDEESFKALLQGQIDLVDGLIEFSDADFEALAEASRKVEGEERRILELKMQRRSRILDTYFSQITSSIQLANQYGLDVAALKEETEQALIQRAGFLANVILYIDTEKQETESRLKFVNDTEKEELNNQIIRYNEYTSTMVMGLQATTGLMENFGLNVGEYKQLLLTTTGDINADVLDVRVAYGLFEEWMVSFKEWAFDNTPSIIVKLTLFCVILYLTRAISRVVSKAVRKSVKHSKMDFSVLMQDFFVSMASKAVVFVGVLVALSQVGIELGPLLTGFGVAGVIIGFALQDTLSNFASGLMILIYRPYDVGDMVKVAGIQGTVNNMSLVSTTVQTIDNQRLVIPNNKIWGDVINNITAERVRRVDMVFGIGYGDDIDKAKSIFNEILQSDERVLKSPEPVVRLHTLNESSVDFVVRPWVKTDDYWDVYWDVTETVKKRLDAEGVTIPFPQRDVHIYQHAVDSKES
ncbi:mechanosensitive ion channel family protein [Vibrio agarivorans]|uniref:Small-conductance mechanosensitive channel n=1 Tax=Vibrio agarivorans TaxID=153622 RepID=A0ABT7Y6M7_9VIBR|nr:mechanosensitive ion channel domain-containing protein [Vibrio agarivorans]MDN2483704.1 mechanosensitive ion channel [Vibrio agarivorans]